MKECKRCHSQNDDTQVLCPRCGALLGEPQPREPQPEAPAPRARARAVSDDSHWRMSFVRLNAADVLRVCLVGKYANFHGRATCREFWMFLAFVLLFLAVSAVLFMVVAMGVSDSATYDHDALVWVGCGLGILCFLLAMPLLAVGARRLHDSGHSSRLLWLGLVPVAGILLLLFYMTLPSQRRHNRYGKHQIIVH